jgi:hypothetical protein
MLRASKSVHAHHSFNLHGRKLSENPSENPDTWLVLEITVTRGLKKGSQCDKRRFPKGGLDCAKSISHVG